MSRDEDPLEEPFAALLSAWDEALAAGLGPPAEVGAAAPEGLRQRLERGAACLRRLRRCWPRPAAPDVRQLGRFQVRRELGRGTFGVVFLAHDPHLGREVALKVPRAEGLVTAELRQRFLREARAAAGLDHPNIVPVYEAGAAGPICYIASAYCPGPTLAAWLKARTEPVPFRVAAGLLAALAEAVRHAHARGVIHRDLKPANVLLGIADCSDQSAICDLQSAIPKITDFGLAKVTAEGNGPTLSTSVLGTPAYMAPEQASGRSAEAGPAADVYALGAILYELLTGRPPFHGDSALDTLGQVRTQEPVAPSRLRPRCPRDLETICLKCLEKEPRRRYAGVAALAEDLACFLGDRPIRARRAGWAERAGRWARRNPRVAILGASTALLLLLGAAGAAAAAVWLHAARNEALANLGRAEKAEADATEKLWRSYLDRARAGRWSGRPGRRFDSLEALAEAAKIRPALELRNEAIACMALVDIRRTRPWPGWPDGTTCLACDRRCERYARGDRHGNVSVRRLRDDRELASLPGPGQDAGRLEFSPDGRFLTAVYRPNWSRWRLFDLATGRLVLDLEACQTAAAFSPDSRRLAVARRDGSVSLFETATGREVKRLTVAPGEHALAFHPDSRRLAITRAEPPGVVVCDTASGRVLRTLTAPPGYLAWHPDGGRLAVAAGFQVYLWDATADRQLRVLEGSQSVVNEVCFSHRGGLLVTAAWDGRVRLWDADTGSQLVSDRAGGGCMLTFSDDDRLLACTRDGGEVSLWEVAGGDECRLLRDRPPAEGQGIFCLDMHPNGRLLAGASNDGVRLYDAEAGEIARLTTEPGRSAFFLPDGGLLTRPPDGLYRRPIRTVAGQPGALRVGRAERLLEVPHRGGSAPEACVFGDGSRIAVADPDRRRVLVRNVKDGTVQEVPGQPNVLTVVLSPDGRWLAAGTEHQLPGDEVRVVDLRTGNVAHAWPTYYTRAAFSPDGTRLVFGGDACQVWRVGTWELERTVAAEPGLGPAEMAAFSPDGRALAISYLGRVVRLVEVASGRELARFAVPEEPIVSRICFRRDGGVLALGCAPHLVQLWDLRRVRRRLAEMGLDWDTTPPPAAVTDEEAPPLHVVEPPAWEQYLERLLGPGTSTQR